MTVEGATTCNEVYNLFSWNAENINNEGNASSANNPNEYTNINNVIAEGKYDSNVIWNIEVWLSKMKEK